MYLGVVQSSTSLSLFLPSFVKDIGYTAAAAQIRSVPVFLAAAVCALATAYASDHLRHRFSFCIFGVIVAMVGYIMLLKQGNLAPGVRYFATFVVACGAFITQPLTIPWLSNNGTSSIQNLSLRLWIFDHCLQWRDTTSVEQLLLSSTALGILVESLPGISISTRKHLAIQWATVSLSRCFCSVESCVVSSSWASRLRTVSVTKG